MPLHADNHDWETFLARREIAGDPVRLRAAHEGKTILLTGAREVHGVLGTNVQFKDGVLP